MFLVNLSIIHDLCPLYYCSLWWNLSNGLMINPNEDRMQNICPRKVDVPTYDFTVKKTIGISSNNIMFRLYCRWSNGVGPLHYCATQWDLFNGLLSDPKKDYMQKLCLGNVDIPTCLLVVHKNIDVSYYRVMFRVNHIWNNFLSPSHYFSS